MKEKRISQRVIAAVIALTMVLVLVPIGVLAEEYSGDGYWTTHCIVATYGDDRHCVGAPEIELSDSEKTFSTKNGYYYYYSKYSQSLRLNNVDCDSLDIDSVGSNLELDLSGSNHIDALLINAYHGSCKVTIKGSGTLTTSIIIISMVDGYDAKLEIENPAKVEVVGNGVNDGKIHLISDQNFTPSNVFQNDGLVDKELVFERDLEADKSDVIYRSTNSDYKFFPATVNITLNPNGGYWHSDDTTDERVVTTEAGKYTEITHMIEEPVHKEHKIFVGYLLADELSKYTSGDYSYETDSDVTLYACWADVPDDKVIVIFDGCGGITASGKGTEMIATRLSEVEKGKAFKETMYREPYYESEWAAPEGKKFAGWYKDKEYTIAFDENEIMNDDIILYAKWVDKDKPVVPTTEPTTEPTTTPSDNTTTTTTKSNDSSTTTTTQKSGNSTTTTTTKPDTTPVSGLREVSDGVWAMLKNGQVDTSYTGIAKNEYGWWRVKNGYVDFNANGIYKNQYGWWKTTNGKVTFKETGVFKNENGWWRVENSKVNFKANGIYKNKYGWWKTTNGKVNFKENGVYKNEYGWWKVKNSKVDFNFTGIASNKNGKWYIKNGKVDFSKNGKVKYNGTTYTIKNGKAR